MTTCFARLALPMLGLAALSGCSSPQTALNVQRDHSEQAYVARFDRAYFTEAVDGQFDLVLLSDGVGEAAVDRPLSTKTDQSVRQIVHIRVLWQHGKGLRTDNPSASNAMISWHVVASPKDRLIYGGACWAKVDIDGDEAEIQMRNATISISQLLGNVQDPLKRATISGEIVAKRSDSTVRSYIDELASLTQNNTTAISISPNRLNTTP